MNCALITVIASNKWPCAKMFCPHCEDLRLPKCVKLLGHLVPHVWSNASPAVAVQGCLIEKNIGFVIISYYFLAFRSFRVHSFEEKLDTV